MGDIQQIAEYNPLDLPSLGESIVSALSAGTMWDFPASNFSGAGIYAIYYQGRFSLYRELVEFHRLVSGGVPIYIGKAAPSGSRKGGVGLQREAHREGRHLSARLSQHAASIKQVENLDLGDFKFRALIVNPTWLALAESALIRRYKPLWNSVVDGFGNHDPGRGRKGGRRTQWDELHPGREWTSKHDIPRLERSGRDKILAEVSEYMKRLKESRPKVSTKYK